MYDQVPKYPHFNYFQLNLLSVPNCTIKMSIQFNEIIRLGPLKFVVTHFVQKTEVSVIAVFNIMDKINVREFVRLIGKISLLIQALFA